MAIRRLQTELRRDRTGIIHAVCWTFYTRLPEGCRDQCWDGREGAVTEARGEVFNCGQKGHISEGDLVILSDGQSSERVVYLGGNETVECHAVVCKRPSRHGHSLDTGCSKTLVGEKLLEGDVLTTRCTHGNPVVPGCESED